MPWWNLFAKIFNLLTLHVEIVGFLNHRKTLDPLYQPALHTHFSRIAIPSNGDDVGTYSSFTTDLWTGCGHSLTI